MCIAHWLQTFLWKNIQQTCLQARLREHNKTPIPSVTYQAQLINSVVTLLSAGIVQFLCHHCAKQVTDRIGFYCIGLSNQWQDQWQASKYSFNCIFHVENYIIFMMQDLLEIHHHHIAHEMQWRNRQSHFSRFFQPGFQVFPSGNFHFGRPLKSFRSSAFLRPFYP